MVRDRPRSMRPRSMTPKSGPAARSKRTSSLVRKQDNEARIVLLDQRLADAEALIRSLLAGNVELVLERAKSDPAFKRLMQKALRSGMADRGAVLEQMPVGVVVIDLSGRLLLTNGAAARLRGVPYDPARSVPLQELDLSPMELRTDRPLAPSELPASRALLGESVQGFELVIQRPGNGERVTLRMSAVPRRDERQRIVGAICTYGDVTRERDLLGKLGDSEARLRAMHAAVACGLSSHDVDGKIVTVNEAALTMLGTGLPDLLGRTLVEAGYLIASEDGTPLQEEALPWHMALTLRSPQRERLLRITRPDKEELWVVLDSVPMLDETERLIGVVSSFTDVTARRRAESAQQVQMLQTDRMASVGSLAAGMAHEINNPLAYISANISFASEELQAMAVEPEDRAREVQQALSEAQEGARRIRDLVRDLRVFAQADDDHRDVLDVRAPIEAACKMAENEIRQRARLVKRLESVPPVYASETRLIQLLLNLLVNAAQAIDPERDDGEIGIATCVSSTGDVMIEVLDTGRGIAPEILPRIFDPFFTQKPVGEGTGLGLAICQAIAHAHGGTLSVQSTVGRGSNFTLTLPAYRGAGPGPRK